MSMRSGGSSSTHNNPYLVKRSYSTPCENSEEELGKNRMNKTPPITPLKNQNNKNNNCSSAKMVNIKVLLLDESVTLIQAQPKALGRLIFDQICKQLNILEADYFGVEYVDENGVTYWLDLEKRLTRQVGLNMSDPMLKFSVKFYTPDPSQLEEEFTRYLFSLQLKKDLSTGALLCNDNTAALMASYIVQAECGDFSEEDYPDASYLSVYKFVPHQNYELERKIRENHKKHIGQSPAEADLHLLETARRTEIYGIRFHPGKDEDGVSLNLSVCHMGVVVFQNMTKINTFSWAKIRKISFKRKRFILKLHPETYQGYYKELVEFIFDSRNECKAYWKRCVEHHAFFRCEKAPNPIHRSKGILSSRGSSFRYSGRTQKQMVAFVRENFVKRPNQYHSMSQQNLSTLMGNSTFDVNSQVNSQQQQINFQRSSSFKNQQQGVQQGRMYDQRPVGILGSQQVVSNSRSSPAMITDDRHHQDRGQNYEEEEDEELEEEEEEFSDYVVEPTSDHSQKSLRSNAPSKPLRQLATTSTTTLTPDTSVTSSPIRDDYQNQGVSTSTSTRMPQLQQGSNTDLPPDWYYYISKELLNMYRTYKKDMQLLIQYYKPNSSNNFITATLNLTRTFSQNIEELKKEHWETRNGNELIYQLTKYFENQKNSYKEYFNHVLENYESICLNDNTNHYIGKCCLYLRPFEFVKYVKIDFVSVLINIDSKIVDKLVKSLEELFCISQSLRIDLISGSKVFELVKEMQIPNLFRICQNNLFLRQGILLKLNKKRGLQNRIFFLFRDVLCYGSRISSSLGFRLHGLILTSQMELSDSHKVEISGIPHSFVINVTTNMIQNGNVNSSQQNINFNQKILVLAAFNEKDKENWTLDIKTAIKTCNKIEGLLMNQLSNYNSSEEILKTETNSIVPNINQLQLQQHRSNATTHVCWHRNLTISSKEILNCYGVTISGYLLRKFKNSPGWQRLWVVYTNVCLYFYKTHSINETNADPDLPPPLASLPLLGYRVSTPTEQDNINKEHVFKLSFKNHVYFFRAESPFTFQRWFNAIQTSTSF